MKLGGRIALFFALFFSSYLLFIMPACASDVDVYEVALMNYNGSASPKTLDIRFSVAQDNTFTGTDANSQSYYDRVYIFVKYWKSTWDANTAWKHATLAAGGTISTYSGGIGITADGKGAFSSPGANQTVRWQIGTDETVDGTESFKVRVFAIEMALVPAGTFYVGDGTTTTVQGQFRDGAANTPLQLTGEGTLTLGGTTAGYLANNNATGMYTADDFNDTTTQTLPLAFPKGFNAFYIMKYEISQKGYADFLNTLTRVQQNTRTETNVSTDAITNTFVMSGTATYSSSYRNAIRCPASGNGTTNPITFGCDANENGTFNESNDGQWRACNYLSWMDLAAYADWAGLRPMTELEFEKACRGGGSSALANEYAWGSTTIDYFSDLSNDGQANEAKGPTRPNANCNYDYCTPNGPVRVGMFTTASSTRQQAGAAYYGAMEMSGNLWERPISVGNATGRGFTGTHGDGLLTTAASYEGNATNTDWPGYNAAYPTRGVYGNDGSGVRGCSWYHTQTDARVSDRRLAGFRDEATRPYSEGGRFARTSP